MTTAQTEGLLGMIAVIGILGLLVLPAVIGLMHERIIDHQISKAQRERASQGTNQPRSRQGATHYAR
ncbi:hypothetical protein AB0N17_25600 [Streptomyces sp. NPDC051133]|uniref:hypothetical protein n=1 Tax=Streptomyces sp. NPDC051133 TaxID=3155521 RepID=UPI003419E5E9